MQPITDLSNVRFLFLGSALAKAGPGSGKKIAHQSGFALYGNPPRWRKITPEKPAPKGAPVSKHPEAGGAHIPKQHFSAEQWSQLKLPDTNVNAGSFNKALDKLKEWSDAGNVTAILGAGYGVNTYGKKLVAIANSLLAQYGSQHKVAPGQKAGTHSAVASPAAEHADDKQAVKEIKAAPTVDAALETAKQHMQDDIAEGVGGAAETKQDKAVVGKLEAAQGEDTQALKDKLQMLHDFLKEKPDSPNAAAWEAKIAEIEAKVGPLKSAEPAKAEKPTVDTSGWSQPAQAAYALKQEYAKLDKLNNKAVGAFKIKLRALAKKTPEDDQKATLLLDGLATKVWGSDYDPKVAGLEFAPAAAQPSPAADAGPAPAAKGDVFKLDSQYEKMNAGDWTVYNVSGDGDLVYMHKVGAKVPNQKNSATIPAATLQAAIDKGTAKKIVAPAAPDLSPAAQPKFQVGQSVVVSPDLTTKHAGMSGQVVEVIGWDIGAGTTHHFKVKLEDGSYEPFQPGELEEPIGPQEGDTKPAADGGLLVLKDGHWVKQGGDEPAAEAWSALTADQKATILAAASPLYTTGYTGKPNASAKKLAAAGWGDLTDQIKAKVSPYISMHAHAKQEAAAKPASVMPEKPVISDPVADKDQSPLKTIGGITFEAVKSGAVWKVKVAGTDKLIDGIHSDSKGGLWSKLSQHHSSVGADSFASEFGGKTETPLSPQQLQNLQSIPWFKLKLPAENTNAKSHNGAVAKIEAMAFAGDKAGLQAFIDAKAGAKQTYAKKQHLLAMTALAALQDDDPAEAEAAPTPVMPTPAALGLDGGAKPADKAGVDVAGLSRTDKKVLASLVANNDLQTLADGAANSKNPAYKKAASEMLAKLQAQQPPAPTPTSKVKIKVPVYENTTPGHNKFWSVSVSGNVLKTEYGKIGTMGKSTLKKFDSNEAAQAAASKLISQKKAKGYVHAGTGSHEHEVAADQPVTAPDDGPKNGDTKRGVSGTLVFWDGHWHKVMPMVSDLIDNLNAAGLQKVVASPEARPASKGYAAAKLAQMGESALNTPVDGGWDLSENDPGFSGQNMLYGPDGLVVSVSTEDGAQLFKIGEDSIDTLFHGADLDDLTSMMTSAGYSVPPEHMLQKLDASYSAAPAAPQPTPAASTPTIPAMDNWTQTGPQKGSNPGGKFKDPSGQEWYCKWPSDTEAVKSEVLAAKLYALAGLSSQDCMLVTRGGKTAIATKWTDIKKASSATALSKVDGVYSGFAVDAWLGNWDVIGMGLDNLQIGPDGKAHRVDAGGSLEYRAQGAKKEFGHEATEIDSLLDPKINPHAAAVFKKITQADITASVAKVASVSDAQIRALVFEFGPGSAADKKKLAETLIARKAYLLAKYPRAVAKPAKSALDPSALPIDPSLVPKPHDFQNWNGQGKGLSSKAHINQSNEAVEYVMMGLAQAGNMTALRDFKFHEVNKETGVATGKMLPVKQHPSKHVQQYHQDLLQLLDEVANPPEPLKVFRETDVGSLEALNAAFPPKKFGTTVSKVASNEKLGFWVALGAVAGVAKFAPKATSHYSAAAKAAAKAKFAAAGKLAKHFIHSVQASGSYNDLFRDGKTHDKSGHDLKDVAKAALEHATEMPEGTTIYRWQKMTPQMLQHVMSAKDGTVFQATGPMCTSYDPVATKGFGQHRVVIRYAKGAKAVESFASGGFAGEKEVTTLPNARFVILSRKMVPDVEHGKPNSTRMELEILMLPPDLGL